MLLWRAPQALVLGSAIAVPLINALVYAFVWADAGESSIAQALIWERFLERAWAVIVLDFLINYVWTAALVYSTSTKPLELLAGLAAFGFCVVTAFADAVAVVDDDVSVWNVIPRSLVRSVATAWNSTIFVRALAIVSLSLLAYVAQSAAYFSLVHFNVPQAEFWSDIPIGTIVAPPLAAITVVVYRDATNVLK